MKLHNKDIYVPLRAFSYEYSPAVNMFDIFTAHIVQLNQVCEIPLPPTSEHLPVKEERWCNTHLSPSIILVAHLFQKPDWWSHFILCNLSEFLTDWQLSNTNHLLMCRVSFILQAPIAEQINQRPATLLRYISMHLMLTHIST